MGKPMHYSESKEIMTMTIDSMPVLWRLIKVHLANVKKDEKGQFAGGNVVIIIAAILVIVALVIWIARSV